MYISISYNLEQLVMKTTIVVLFHILFLPWFVSGQIMDTTCICDKWSNIGNKQVLVEEMPSYPGGYKALTDLFNSNIRIDSSIYAKIKVSFIVGCKGKTCGFLLKSKSGNITKETEEKIDVQLRQMNIWNPAKQMGKTVDVPFNISILISGGVMQITGPS